MDISRSEQKRRLKQLEQLVSELAALPPGVISRLPCSTEIRELFHHSAEMKGGARKRQLKYIAKQLRNESVEQLYTFFTDQKGAALQEKKEFHELEFYRNSLLNEALELHRIAEENQEEMDPEWDSPVLEKIAAALPGVDRKSLFRLAFLFARTRNRRYSREIFRLLRAAHEQQLRA